MSRYLLFIVIFVLEPILTRETIGLTVTLSSRQTFSKHLFWTVCEARVLLTGKLPSNICCVSIFSSRILFSSRETIG